MAFPDQSDNSVRKKLKQISDFRRGGTYLSIETSSRDLRSICFVIR